VVGQDVAALRKHIALIGFMGAGKSTIGREVARLAQRQFVDLDEEIEKRHGPIAKIFDERGEPEFRRIEEELAAEVLAYEHPLVIALGGGTVMSEGTRHVLAGRALNIWIEIDVEEAWRRARSTDRPLARDEEAFRRLYGDRQALYLETCAGTATDVEDVLLHALAISLGSASQEVDGELAIICDEGVLELHRPPLDGPTHTVPAGEQAKALAVVERLWSELELDRSGTIVAFGGGSTTDVAGYVAATYLRGVRWVAVPTTLVGQVDAAIGGKTGINLEKGKNLVGAFHFPEAVEIDTALLATLPVEERRAGMAEVVKTGLLAGAEFWDLPEDEMVRACAAFKAAVVLADPYETFGRRAILNLGHTFAHALEAGSGYTVRHGDAVALGLLAALRLSGQPTDVVEEILAPEPVRADPDAAWAALKRDKKGEGVFVLLEEPGKPVVTTVPDKDARRALESLMRK
jgi:shikimate kinase / 3-dehydroquinate synthase